MARRRARSKKPETWYDLHPPFDSGDGPPRFTAQQWDDGLNQVQWAEYRDYDGLVEAMAMTNNEGTVFLTVEPGSHHARLHFSKFEQILKFRRDLKDCLQRRDYTLGWRERYNAWKPVPDEAIRDVLDALDFGVSKERPAFWEPRDKIELTGPYQGRDIRVRIFRPDRFNAAESAGTKEYEPPKATLGRPPKWDWEGAERHLFDIADDPDGLPKGRGAQAQLKRELIAWFSNQDEEGEHPTESDIKKFIRKKVGHRLNKAGN